MVEKKKEVAKKPKETKQSKKTIQKEEEFSLIELFAEYNLNEYKMFGFTNYYGLLETIQKEAKTGKTEFKLTKTQFEDMMKKYNERKI